MAIKTPLFFEYDDSTATPSSIGEFTASDVVAQKNGGTGTSSFVEFGATLATYDLSAKSLSSMTVVAVDLSATMLSATLVSALTVSANNIFTSDGVSCVGDGGAVLGLSRIDGATYPNLIRASDGTLTLQAEDDIHLKSNGGEDFARFNENAAVWLYYNNTKVFETQTDGVIINTSLSSTSITGADAMPLPAPFGYVQCDSAGTDSTDMLFFASGATTTNIVSNSDDITWNDTLKVFNVLKAGTYEIISNLIVDAGAQNNILTVTSRKNGAVVLTIAPRIYGNVGPVERTFHNILTAAADDTLTIGIEMGSTKTIHLEEGSTLTIKRLK